MADCGGFGSIDVLVKASGFSDAALRLVIGLFSGNFDYIVCGEQYLPDDDYILDNHGVESRVATTLEKSYLFFMFSYSLLHRRQSRSSQVFILFVYFFFFVVGFFVLVFYGRSHSKRHTWSIDQYKWKRNLWFICFWTGRESIRLKSNESTVTKPMKAVRRRYRTRPDSQSLIYL